MSFLSRDIPKLFIALSNTSDSISLLLTNEERAAIVMFCASISKNLRRFGLVSDLPNPSVPRTE